MLDTLNSIKQRFEERLQKLKDINDLEELRVAFTGKKVSSPNYCVLWEQFPLKKDRKWGKK